MLDLIPKPKHYEERYGEFIFNAATTVYADTMFTGAMRVLIQLVEKVCGFKMEAVASPQAPVRFLNDHHLHEEGYRIECSGEELLIYASTAVGARYAVESIRQLTLADRLDAPKVLSMHAMLLDDEPNYRWRALLLDEARTFFGLDGVKRVLDRMAQMKMNVLHWHLTDNEGWRIEIKKYPLLTLIGGTRKGTQSTSWRNPKVDWTPVGGYYTQDEIKEVVAYAAARGIIVVPEIDMPAHFAAALSAYPELGCRGVKLEPSVRHNGTDHGPGNLIACAGKTETYQFIYDVLDEVCALFPAPYIHIGGDEAPKQEWKACPHCQAVIKEKGLKDEEELQAYFTNKILVYLSEKGKRTICWNEVLKSHKVHKDVVVQYWTWQRDKRAEQFVREGKTLIFSKHQGLYLDMPYAQYPLKMTYMTSPKKFGLEDQGNILGMEGTFWTEWMFNEARLEYQMFPRLQALAEAAWSTGEKDYREFKARLKRYLPVLDRQNINYAPEAWWDRSKVMAPKAQSTFAVKDAHRDYNRAMKAKARAKKK